MATVKWLDLDRDATIAFSQGIVPEVKRNDNVKLKIQLEVWWDYLPVQVSFITPFIRRPGAKRTAGYSFVEQKLSWTIDYDSSVDPDKDSEPPQNILQTVGPGCVVVATSPISGSIIGLYRLTADPYQIVRLSHSTSQLVSPNYVAPPNDQFSLSALEAPPQGILVGFGADPLAQAGMTPGYVTLHEQVWRFGDMTVTLAPQERRTVSFLRETGLLESTTTQDQITQTLSVSASASAAWGWGSISAQIAASFSNSHSQTHTVTTTTREVVSIEHRLYNPNKEPVYVVEWRMVDRYVIRARESGAVAVIESVQPASIIRTAGTPGLEPVEFLDP